MLTLVAVLAVGLIPWLGATASTAVADSVPAGATTGSVTRITTSGLDECCGDAEVSADGRYVTFAGGEVSDIYQYDHLSGVTTRITEGDRNTLGFKVSDDGGSVVFTSDATNLVPGEVGGIRDAYLWRRDSGLVTSLSGYSSGASWFNYARGLSADGRYAVFSSNEPQVPGITGEVTNLFLYDSVAETTTAITNGNAGSDGSLLTVARSNVEVPVSADGRYVTFTSSATDLVDTPTNDGANLFQWDRLTGITTRITNGRRTSQAAGVSPDGRYVTFVSRSPGIVPEATGITQHVYQWDRVTGTTVAVALESTDTSVEDVSADGSSVLVWRSVLEAWDRSTGSRSPVAPAAAPRALAWNDDASLVVVNVTGGPLKLYDRGAATLEPISTDTIGLWPDRVMISADGTTVTWTSSSREEVSGVGYGVRMPYQWNRASGKVIALAAPEAPAVLAGQDADGSRVVFSSASRSLDSDPPAGVNGFLWDRAVQPTRPAAPQLGATTPQDRAIDVAWTPPFANGSSARTGYQLEVKPAGVAGVAPQLVDLGAGITSHTIDGLVNGTSYVVRVRAVNDVGAGFWSAPATGLVPATRSDAPTGVTAVAGDAFADVTWSPPANTGGTPVEWYRVQPIVDGEPVGLPWNHNATTTARVPGLDNGTAYQFEVTAFTRVGESPPSIRSAPVTPRPPGPTFVPVTPCRLLDTRTADGPVQPGASRLVRVTEAGRCDVPADALAIEATVTAVGPAGNGFLRAYPQGFSPPTATFLNYARGEDTTNTGTIAVTPTTAPSTGLALRTYGNATHVVIDVQGYYRRPLVAPEGALFVAATPCRAFDSRAVGTRRPLAAGERRDLAVVGQPGCNVPANVVAVEATVTAVESPGSGFVRAWPSDQSAPTATFLTHVGGRSTTNTGTIAIHPGAGAPNLSLRNFGTPTHLVVDIQGWFVPAPAPPAATFTPRIPCRILDTRTSGGQLPAGGSRSVPVTGIAGCNVPPNAVAIEATVTAVDPAGSGFLRAWPAGVAAPQATFLNFAGGRSATNTGTIAIRPGSGSANLELRNFGSPAHFVVDVQGWFVPTTPPAPPG